MKEIDVLIIGAGAAGLQCAIGSGKRQRSTLVIDHANKPGKKILMSGGGRCNFTNYHIAPDKYISHNPHFCKSALSRYTQWDVIEWVKSHGIAFHEKTQGQLFCDNSAKELLQALLKDANSAGVKIQLNETVQRIECKGERDFLVHTTQDLYHCQSLVVASGGLSIPTMGATGFGYDIAKQFNLKVWPTRAGLVPLTLHDKDKALYATLSGISQECRVSTQKTAFHENLLFTHRGLSGPSILQLSSYWVPGQEVEIDFLPSRDIQPHLLQSQRTHPKKSLKEWLSGFLPKRLSLALLPESLRNVALQSLTPSQCRQLDALLHRLSLKPNGTEGYRTAEVTLGGVDCNALSSKTMEVKSVPGLYFIGEVLDVTGWLGGYNFQWAWASGWSAGQVV